MQISEGVEKERNTESIFKGIMAQVWEEKWASRFKTPKGPKIG